MPGMQRQRLRSFGVLGGIVGLLLSTGAACSAATGASTGRAEALKITLTAMDFAFAPGELRLAANRPVHLTYRNAGKLEHDFVIVGMDGVEQQHANGSQNIHGHEAMPNAIHAVAQPGEQVTVDFTLKMGTYDLSCSVPGHKEAGMHGTVHVG